MNRRHFLSLAAVTGVTSLYEGKRLRGQGTGSQQRNSADLITNETQDAIERGLAYLGSRQHSAGRFWFAVRTAATLVFVSLVRLGLYVPWQHSRPGTVMELR